MAELISTHIAKNVKELRQSRNLTQAQLAKVSGIPRPTWANLESGNANPTVAIMLKVAGAFQVPLEELISAPRANVKLYPADSVPKRQRNGVMIRKLLPDALKGVDFERMEFSGNAHIVGIPHRAGTREYLTCESGQIELTVGGELFKLTAGDVVVFRGDQRHSYRNLGERIAVGYSAVVIQSGTLQGE
jgi:transcriptional regulator with XRE-family HTH domain